MAGGRALKQEVMDMLCVMNQSDVFYWVAGFQLFQLFGPIFLCERWNMHEMEGQLKVRGRGLKWRI